MLSKIEKQRPVTDIEVVALAKALEGGPMDGYWEKNPNMVCCASFLENA